MDQGEVIFTFFTKKYYKLSKMLGTKIETNK